MPHRRFSAIDILYYKEPDIKLNNNNSHFRALIQKYLNNTATSEERAAVERYYDLFEEEPRAIDAMGKAETDHLEQTLLNHISREIRPSKSISTQQIVFRWAVVAAVVSGLVLFISLYLPEENQTVSSHQLRETTPFISQASYNRFLQLPDGTTVVLHGHSSLTYDDSFNVALREVTLTGEAYFDVKHNPEIPFVIHTGKLKTTVLGTAFNIKAWPEQKDITVSVTRGKVKVENENKFLAILTQDKQVVYNVESDNADQHKIEADSSLAWIQADMTFDNMPFAKLAEHLAKRYNLEIIFKNEDLKNCSFTGRFTGIETFTEVMNILSATSNTTFSLNGNQVIISGEKCI